MADEDLAAVAAENYTTTTNRSELVEKLRRFEEALRIARSVLCANAGAEVDDNGSYRGGASVESEERQGKLLIDAAVRNGVKHFVYSSVDRGGLRSDTGPTNVPHFISKYRIEQHLLEKVKNYEMSWTILRPVAFFENLVPGFLGKVFSTSWRATLRPEQILQLIATSDIGFFAAQALMQPEEDHNKKITLAGDELTYNQLATIFQQKTGTEIPVTFNFVAAIINWMVKDLGYAPALLNLHLKVVITYTYSFHGRTVS